MNPKIYKIKCEYCGREFETTVYFARFCSESHRQMGYQKRKKKQEKQQKTSLDAKS
jgi:hypothetical protein